MAIDPPWRLDPLKNIVGVGWGEETPPTCSPFGVFFGGDFFQCLNVAISFGSYGVRSFWHFREGTNVDAIPGFIDAIKHLLLNQFGAFGPDAVNNINNLINHAQQHYSDGMGGSTNDNGDHNESFPCPIPPVDEDSA